MMLFRGRNPDVTVWKRFRSGLDGFTFLKEGEYYEAYIAANAERVVDLFHTLSEQLPPAVDVVITDLRSETTWHGESIALPDVRDAVARLKVPLATYGGVEVSLYTPDDQLTLTPQLELYIYARSDRWLYLLQGKGLEERASLGDRSWRSRAWDGAPAPTLSAAISAAAERLSLTSA
ncbi:MAG TPA: hypothetical protein VM939_06970 [Gemmatimonadaceae bacterium]|nr:hypothetical protein [Gemmatimonadaceae bacterium]